LPHPARSAPALTIAKADKTNRMLIPFDPETARKLASDRQDAMAAIS